jgi:putative acetyltransferase
VAADEGRVVGHVIATPGRSEPLGIPGQALRAVAEAFDERLVALLGSPAYWRRSGFVRSTDLDVAPPDPAGAGTSGPGG